MSSTRCCLFALLLTLASLRNAGVAIASPVTGDTGPGGIGTTDGLSSLDWWLSADAITGLSNGQAVGTWLDRSGNARNVTGNGQTYQTGVVNALPTVLFASQAPFNSVSSMTVGTIHIVARHGAASFSDYDGLFNAQGVGSELDLYFTGNSGSPDWYGNTQLNSRYVDGRLLGPTIPTLNKFNLFSGTDSSPQTYGDWVIGRDRNIGGREWNGDVAEIVVHAGVLNTAERIIVDNHLSSKYNAPLDVTGGFTEDVYSGDTAGFDFGVFGVGRVNAGNQLLNSGMDGMGMEVPSLADDTWALAGHENGPDDVTTADAPNGIWTVGSRWERSWFVDTDGVASADLAFDWDDALNTATYDPTYSMLMYRPTNSGPFSIVAIGLVDTINQRVDFSGIALQDGFYTLGGVQYIPEPSTFALLGLGAVGLAARARRRRTLDRRTSA